MQSEGCQSWHDGFLPADECALFNLRFIDIAAQGDLPCTPGVSCVDRCRAQVNAHECARNTQ